ncbi:MBL fold metallo-hydrolase [Nannocystis pusilla]|uniref:MBL fold metallo-hydrolase n=1 Tax=Nannocystis pusilla TaxID=889268 RepID=A0ABS7TKR9_9BACT|nr:MBL fold metallo-hydrolase [Nannocystis pusilla]MBZ5708806.1 MBL fold metallo-hydrolase [Nannocystis pusilla]
MSDTQFALPSDAVPSVYLPVQMTPVLSWEVLQRVVRALQAEGRPTALESLFDDDVAPGIRELFARAREETDSPYVLPQALMFPEDLYPMCFRLPHADDTIELEITEDEELRALRSVLSGEWQEAEPGDPGAALGREFVEEGLLRPAVPGARIVDFERPGIYRLQHASLMFRSESSAVICDPQFSYATEHSWLPREHYPNIDAILVSHSHTDHFCLASLMRFPRDTPIVVPRMRRASLLSPPMADILRAAGFTRVCDAAWFSTHVFGDIRVTIYPFYGEQPWLTFASPDEDLRNWGNTYVVEANGVKTWFLVDSGREFGRSMQDLCGRVREEQGHIDVVMSNLREFGWSPGQIDGTGRYLYCFPEEIVMDPQRWPTGELMTFGVHRARELLDTLEPSCFLPYAHWWHPIETRSHLVDGRVSERQMLEALRESPRAKGRMATQLLEWHVGDRLQLTQERGLVFPPGT